MWISARQFLTAGTTVNGHPALHRASSSLEWNCARILNLSECGTMGWGSMAAIGGTFFFGLNEF